jgi:hypothetical protein
MNNLYWRNTKESIKNEYELPPLVDDVVFLELTPIELALYNDCVTCFPEGIKRGIGLKKILIIKIMYRKELGLMLQQYF